MANLFIKSKKGKEKIRLCASETVFDALLRMGMMTKENCGGVGTCGKCSVQFVEGAPEPSKTEQDFFSKKEIEQGYRLACQILLSQDGVIEIDESNRLDRRKTVDDIRVMELDDIEPYRIEINNAEQNDSEQSDKRKEFSAPEYGVAVDLGTTTLAFALVNLETGKVEKIYTMTNHQRQYGLDVISRIQSANKGKARELQSLILNDIRDGIGQLRKDDIVIKRLLISGNTTMGHLLLGYSCKGLGHAPFIPESLSYEERDMELDDNKGVHMSLCVLPGISAFVGADIVSGLYKCKMMDSQAIALFVDFGTNGEIVLGNKKKLYATATAVGPAFEGANISCGTASVPGAICKVNCIRDEFVVDTIDGKSPIGICGTGLIEAIYELLKAGIIDRNGTFTMDKYQAGISITQDENGKDIKITQNDIRQFQMAKSAVRSGIELLIRRYGIKEEAVEYVYLAGGFGKGLNVYKAAALGMIPNKLKKKTKAVGNTSLFGAVSYMNDQKGAESLNQVIAVTKEINLAMEEEFQSLYVKYMEL